MRITGDLTDEQIDRLERVAIREHISRAEAARRALDMAYPENGSDATIRALRHRASGLWRGRDIDANAYVEALRDEWER